MGNLVPIPYGYDAGNMADANIGELNVNGGELLANLISSWIVTSSLGHNTGELSPECVNTELHDVTTSNYEVF